MPQQLRKVLAAILPAGARENFRVLDVSGRIQCVLRERHYPPLMCPQLEDPRPHSGLASSESTDPPVDIVGIESLTFSICSTFDFVQIPCKSGTQDVADVECRVAQYKILVFNNNNNTYYK